MTIFISRWKVIIIFFIVLACGACLSLHAEALVHAPIVCNQPSIEGFESNCQQVNDIEIQSSKYVKLNKEISEGSTEGGFLDAWLEDGDIKKISVAHYGEIGFRNLTAYFEDQKPVFLADETTYYDRPIYIEGFKEESKTAIWFLFNSDSVFASAPGKQAPPQKVLPELAQTVHAQIDAYVLLVNARGGNEIR